jgi:glycosyltransferase involved in cell wall biosynthesis
VVPWIDIPVVIVGKGFETMRVELERPGKVTVIGEVDSLSDWYRRCQFVIAPIFDGSGMKTKVAEALMYGKKIIGTPEAFVGYEKIVDRAGYVCETSKEFIYAMEVATRTINLGFDYEVRSLYEELYSFNAAYKRMKYIFGV